MQVAAPTTSRQEQTKVASGLPEETVRGPEGVKAYIGSLRAGVPDLTVTVDDQIVDGDKVATRWNAHGTHDGELMGIGPTGRTATVTGITIQHIGNAGRTVEGWTNWDTLGMLRQLGAAPSRNRPTGPERHYPRRLDRRARKKAGAGADAEEPALAADKLEERAQRRPTRPLTGFGAGAPAEAAYVLASDDPRERQTCGRRRLVPSGRSGSAGTLALTRRSGSQPGAGGHHRRAAYADRGDDLFRRSMPSCPDGATVRGRSVCPTTARSPSSAAAGASGRWL